MSEIFKHIIITRFCIGYRRSTFLKKKKVTPEEWISLRFELFDNLLFPAMLNQTNKNFTWALLIDENLPKKVKEKLNSYKKKFSNIEFITGIKGIQLHNVNNRRILIRKIKKYLVKENEYLITTRLDSDDAVSCDFVEKIQKKFKKREFVLDFIKGFSYDYHNNRPLKAKDCSGNAFLSLIEKNKSNIKTVFCFDHKIIIKKLPTVQIKDKRYWVQTIHSCNVHNGYNKKLKNGRLTKKGKKRFAFINK